MMGIKIRTFSPLPHDLSFVRKLAGPLYLIEVRSCLAT